MESRLNIRELIGERARGLRSAGGGLLGTAGGVQHRYVGGTGQVFGEQLKAEEAGHAG